jgi:hypothetical protein
MRISTAGRRQGGRRKESRSGRLTAHSEQLEAEARYREE